MKSQKKGKYKECLVCSTVFYAHRYKIKEGNAKFCSRVCGIKGRRRVVPWNKDLKGIHLSPGSEFKKGVIPKNAVIFKKGHETWNKGKKLPELSEENHPGWKGGKYINDSGYILKLHKNHPSGLKKPYLREHRLVLEAHLGRTLNKDEIVHHLNGDKTDNRVENLQIVTRSEHIRIHRQELYEARWLR